MRLVAFKNEFLKQQDSPSYRKWVTITDYNQQNTINTEIKHILYASCGDFCPVKIYLLMKAIYFTFHSSF